MLSLLAKLTIATKKNLILPVNSYAFHFSTKIDLSTSSDTVIRDTSLYYCM